MNTFDRQVELNTVESPQQYAARYYTAVMGMVQNHRTHYFREPGSEGMHLLVNTDDARLLEEISQQRGGYFPVSHIADGDVGTFLGLPFRARDYIRPGTFTMGWEHALPPAVDWSDAT